MPQRGGLATVRNTRANTSPIQPEAAGQHVDGRAVHVLRHPTETLLPKSTFVFAFRGLGPEGVEDDADPLHRFAGVLIGEIDTMCWIDHVLAVAPHRVGEEPRRLRPSVAVIMTARVVVVSLRHVEMQ